MSNYICIGYFNLPYNTILGLQVNLPLTLVYDRKNDRDSDLTMTRLHATFCLILFCQRIVLSFESKIPSNSVNFAISVLGNKMS